ncbi:chemotaxis regulatory protein ChePep [Helicobacter pylori]|uniref:chemotaxis regulatory protein ChePep n=1 Tax=Helicobacter pylori TaxID=210 RepID=UPI000EAE8DB5|nr:chemotaxis regulatory protein ChePep [Helicobacter pylori]
MKMILFNQNPMITKLLESVSKKLELSMENFNHYQELPTRLKEDLEWILIADDECLEKLDQVDWLELKEIISQNKNSVCMYKKGNEAQPFLEGFEMKVKKPFLPTEVLKILQKKLGSNMSELEPSQNLDPTQEVLETNWDELENLGDLKALVQEEPNNEEQLLPTLNAQEEKEEVKEEEKEEVKETPQEEEKPKGDETQEGETLKNEEVSKELETQEELEIPKEETQEQVKEQEPIKEETQENKEEKQEKTQDSPSAQELEAMQELVKEIQENSNGQEDKKETQESETPQEKETQELEIPKEETQESAETPQETETQELETPQETPQEKETQELEIPKEETQESAETPQETETQELETPQEEIQENTEKTQKLETQEDHYESIEDIPEPVMAQAMGEELPFLNESVAKTPNNENDTETPKESAIKTPQEKEESDKTSSPLELRLNLQDLLKSLNQESLKSLLENKTLSIKITLEDKKPDA